MPFSASADCPQSLAWGPFHLPSQQCCFSLPLYPSSHLTLTTARKPFSKPGSSPRPNILNLITAAKSSFPCKVTYPQDLEIRADTFGGDHSACHILGDQLAGQVETNKKGQERNPKARAAGDHQGAGNMDQGWPRVGKGGARR